MLEFDAVVVTEKRVGLSATNTTRVRGIAPLIAGDGDILYIVTGHLIGEAHNIAGVLESIPDVLERRGRSVT